MTRCASGSKEPRQEKRSEKFTTISQLSQKKTKKQKDKNSITEKKETHI